MSRMGRAWRRSLLGVGVSLGLLAGCGSRTPIDLSAYEREDAGEQEDAKPDIQYDVLPDSTTCNPAKCPTGCCNAQGCQSGFASGACGKSGFVCVDCTAYGASCDASSRTCTSPQPCSASTCPTGCCVDTYTCVAGTDVAQCGKGGEVCQNCKAQGKFCSGSTHTCTTTATCGAGTCSGCCDANDMCHTTQDNATCGLGGKTCQNCSASGQACNPANGACFTSSCNPDNCQYGCCDPGTGQCLKGMDQNSCGYGGETCHACGDGSMCQSTPMGGGVCSPVGDCNPGNCQYGCCDYSSYPPYCTSGTSSYQCGSYGQVCQYCASPGQQCAFNGYGGECISTGYCDWNTCPNGCCDPYTQQCMWGGDPYQCGTGGQACQYCAGPGQQCIGQPYGGGVCSSSGTCDWTNCPGCCDYNSYPPTCMPGYDQYACGVKGNACVMCDMTQTCENGTCSSSSYCDWTNCSGCCDYSTYPPICQGGWDQYKCGANGAQCLSCNYNQKCINGACWTGEPCGPGNCSGCCDSSTGQCMGGTSSYACGAKGETCQYCSGPGQQCQSNPEGGGYCISTNTCDWQTCPNGCCDYNYYPPMCMGGTDPSACGTGGSACMQCPAGSTCQYGQCQMTQCGPGTCVGCCNQNMYPPTCQPGTEPKMCGQNGNACTTCATTEKCVMNSSGGGQCQSGATCGPSTCKGCCDWNGNCQSGDTNTYCGIKGSQCTNCFISNQICDPAAGTCLAVAGCDPYICSGCCLKTGVCEPGYVSTACGHGGTLCENCSNTGGYCQSGSCNP